MADCDEHCLCQKIDSRVVRREGDWMAPPNTPTYRLERVRCHKCGHEVEREVELIER